MSEPKDDLAAWNEAAAAASRSIARALPGAPAADGSPASLAASVAALAAALERERAAADRLRRELELERDAGTRDGLAARFLRRVRGKERLGEKERERIERGRGAFDRIALEGGTLRAEGWLLLPDREFTSFRLFVDGKWAGETAAEYREDIARDFPWIPHATFTGFRFEVPRGAIARERLFRLDVVGGRGRRHPIARLSSLARGDIDAAIPAPPPALMRRVAATSDPHFFRILGLKSYGEFTEALARWRDIGTVKRLLDWGSGSGRVTAHFLAEHPGIEVHGCDIDAEAIAWARENLPRGKFAAVAPFPPTPYETGSFDLVVAFSVFTHLTRDAQEKWLAELRRILAPGGILLASVSGEFAAWFAFPYAFRHPGAAAESADERRRLEASVARHRVPADLLSAGIYDGVPDDALGSVAPAGYYRCTYQTREYTVREWARHFEVLEYAERGLGNHQDLVVLRRRGAPSDPV